MGYWPKPRNARTKWPLPRIGQQAIAGRFATITTRGDYKPVEVGVKNSPYLAAWGARDLLELRVIAACIGKSEANARDFQVDFVCDNAEFWTSVIKNTVVTHREVVKLVRELSASSGVMEETLLNAAKEEERKGRTN